MMNIGIVVEGERDRAAYPELIQKIRNDVGKVLAEPCGNDIRLVEKFVGWLKHFQWHAEITVNKALVISDSDCNDPVAWESRMSQILSQSHFVPNFPVHFHATKCEIETWLLADENAINQVARNRGKQGSVSEVTIPLESYRNAKELLQRVLSKVRLPVDSKVYQEIASAANIDRIAARCPHFKHFVDRVRAC
jgi:hypothetical protein